MEKHRKASLTLKSIVVTSSSCDIFDVTWSHGVTFIFLYEVQSTSSHTQNGRELHVPFGKILLVKL